MFTTNTAATASRTPGSGVNNAARGCLTSRVTIPSRRPAQSDHPVMRRDNARASSGLEAPRACPIRVCPAIAKASNTYCRKLQIVNPT